MSPEPHGFALSRPAHTSSTTVVADAFDHERRDDRCRRAATATSLDSWTDDNERVNEHPRAAAIHGAVCSAGFRSAGATVFGSGPAFAPFFGRDAVPFWLTKRTAGDVRGAGLVAPRPLADSAARTSDRSVASRSNPSVTIAPRVIHVRRSTQFQNTSGRRRIVFNPQERGGRRRRRGGGQLKRTMKPPS